MPPSINSAYKNVPRVGRAKSRDYLLWEIEASKVLMLQGIRPPPRHVEEPSYRAEYKIFFGNRKRFDAANREKCLSDFLVKHGLIKDDSYLDEILIKKMPIDKENPRVEIVITSLT